jgi:hypothetical protein
LIKETIEGGLCASEGSAVVWPPSCDVRGPPQTAKEQKQWEMESIEPLQKKKNTAVDHNLQLQLTSKHLLPIQ